MPRFKDVTLKWDAQEKRILCDPDIAEVYYRHPKGPSCVRWVVESMPRAAKRVEVKWETESPFLHMGAEIRNKKLCLLGTGNRGKQGLYKYMVLFLDEDDNVVAAIDPGVRDEPEPKP